MIAGLLGEHLASPRTATKTNQNTALEPNNTRDAARPNEDGFASYIAKDTDAASKETPSAEEAIAATPAIDANIGAPKINKLDGEILVSAPAAAGTPETDLGGVALPDPTKTETAAINAPIGAGAISTTAAGEIINDDPRIRAAASPQDSADLPATGTIKLVQDATAAAADVATDRAARSGIDTTLVGRTDPDTIDAEVLRTARTDDSIDARLTNDVEAQVRMTASDGNTLESSVTPVLSRETPLLGGEPTVTIAIASSGNAPSQVNVGLTPTAAAIPVAAPSDLTSVILNAVKNGADPQEQLVVQLDPPELGRVMIDFKFDAQGIQQITVTSDNPEALKRLRELHFELTQALRENGLSDQNMSFRQESGDQSQNAWQNPDHQRPNAPLTEAEDRRASLSATPSQPNIQARDRLDLLL